MVEADACLFNLNSNCTAINKYQGLTVGSTRTPTLAIASRF